MKIVLLLASIAVFTAKNAYGLVYTSIAAGNWNSNAVWSTDGGVTPCNCNPGNNPDGHSFVINHQITIVANTRIRNGNVTINGNNGQISGNYELRFENNTIATVKSGGSIVNVNRIIVKNNSLLVVEDDGFIGTGLDLRLEDSSTLNVQAIGEVYVDNFHMQGSSTLVLNGFMEVSGNFTTTNSAHSVSGTGGLLVQGDINIGNNTTWSGLAWCSAGGGNSNAPAASNDCDHVYSIQGSLPVQLTFFGAEVDNDQVLLIWKTASEVNNHYFVLERSADAISFNALDTIMGAGTTNNETAYRYTDSNPLRAMNYYRLKQVDFDGKFAFSPVISAEIEITNTEPDIYVYPNPSQGELYIQSRDPEKSVFIRGIIANDGKSLNLNTLKMEVNTFHQTIKISGFESGAYIIYMLVGNQVISRHIVVL